MVNNPFQLSLVEPNPCSVTCIQRGFKLVRIMFRVLEFTLKKWFVKLLQILLLMDITVKGVKCMWQKKLKEVIVLPMGIYHT